MAFVPLHNLDQWESLLKDSYAAPIVVMKHSATCGISAYAYELLSRGFQSGELTAPVHVLVVQQSRDLSNHIADALAVRHQSPQILVISKGQCRFNCSHHSITAGAVSEAVRDSG